MHGLPPLHEICLDCLDNAAERRLRVQRTAPADPAVPDLRTERITGPSVLINRDDIIVCHENGGRTFHPAFYFQEDPVKSGISDLRRSKKRRKAFPQKLAESLELIERGLRHVFAGDRAETDHIPEITDYFALFKCHKKPPCLSGRFRQIAAAQREIRLAPCALRPE